uniref:Uncharacterized protein n=1 Tax=Tanacetum cinerariifolium TaxID=118510 RepID=A0A699L2D5_TANCI|nr:hypothetical protein [Tanacetum cinerariifolium]
MRRQGKDFSERVTPVFETMLIQHPAEVGEGSGQPTKSQHTPTTASPSHLIPIPTVASSYETVHEEREDIVERAATTASSLEVEQDSDVETQGRYGQDIEVNTASTSITTASINLTAAEPVTI